MSKIKAGKPSYKWIEEVERSKEIKEELNQFLSLYNIDIETLDKSLLFLIAEHFADWQKEKIVSEGIDSQILRQNNQIVCLSFNPKEYENYLLSKFKNGDRVKHIIILAEDQGKIPKEMYKED